MSLTRAQIRAKLYLRGFGLGFARTATAIASGAKTVTDAVAFSDDNAGDGDYSGKYIYRPAAAAANQVRAAGLVSGSSLTHGGLAYAGDAAVLGYEIVGLLHPDELNECIRLALRRVYFETHAPHTVWTDGDFSGLVTSPFNWTTLASGTTATYSTTAANNQRGYKSLLLTNAGYVYTDTFDVTPGDVFVHGGSAKASGGDYLTTYSLLNASTSAVIGTPVSFTSRAFQHFLVQDTIPEGCYQIRAKLQTAGTSVFDYTCSHLASRETGQSLTLPTWLTESWRLLDFGPAEYGRSLSTSGNTQQYVASSRRHTSWHRPSDYDFAPGMEEASPQVLQINRDEGLPVADMWFHGLRPYSDIVDLDDETDATNGPEDLVMAAVTFELMQTLMGKTEDPKWEAMAGKAKLELDAQRNARRPMVVKKETDIYIPGARSGTLRW